MVLIKQAFYNCQQNAIAVIGFIQILDERATTQKHRTTTLMYFYQKASVSLVPAIGHEKRKKRNKCFEVFMSFTTVKLSNKLVAVDHSSILLKV